MVVKQRKSRSLAKTENLQNRRFQYTLLMAFLAFLFMYVQSMPSFARGAPESFADLYDATGPAWSI